MSHPLEPELGESRSIVQRHVQRDGRSTPPEGRTEGLLLSDRHEVGRLVVRVGSDRLGLHVFASSSATPYEPMLGSVRNCSVFRQREGK